MKFSELMAKAAAHGVAVLELRAEPDVEVGGVCEDSRKTRPGDLFVARSGTKTSGAKFIGDALARGAVAVVFQEPVDVPPAIALAHVESINFTAAILAHEIAGNPTAGMKMVGITGTKGKTTVAYLMRSVLKAAGFKAGMIGTVEIDDGKRVSPAEMTTPGVVELVEMFCRMRENGVTHCVMEVSSHALHQQRVAGIDFTVAMFTNLTGDHLDYHGTMEEYAAAKAILFEGLTTEAVAVVNSDDDFCARIINGCNGRVLKYSVKSDASTDVSSLSGNRSAWVAEITRMEPDGMDLFLTGLPLERTNASPMAVNPRPSVEQSLNLRTSLVGRHNAYNLMCAIAGAKSLGLGLGQILDGLSGFSGEF